ncbi:RNA-directed DNA polymerase [Bradyrhizobium sp. 38]|uniref:retron Ec67 family RNA-directed DNA polymerase/endonuclease n=1 Tax=unclassified Bradyrhizobium TaxID=2631580 RepID=UPI001FF9F0BF|nr:MULTISPECIES: retron Ec67 family RNA-directed DNA polymerase/endonuclease [unclassified Bradyrhizobium]MCK1339786.1 RNA-directed DNA polymerase [Bradyrhizobium sp. 38]MCK1782717.1 RNA-directed DNA polymerase [Bradyrhizobium sp. 132]
MSILQSLRAAKTRYDLAALLGYSPSGLSFIVYQIPKAAKYTTFDVKKKDGGQRRIDAPIPMLKALQKRLAGILYECLRELEESDKRRNNLSHAFRKNRSIITNAMAHRSRRYVLNLDLQNFFPSLNFGRVRGFFLNNNQFKLAEPVATTLAQIACNDGVLPQGSPCSPILSELLTHFLDMRMVKLATKSRCSYTRYADDITFSTNLKAFPASLAVAVGSGWALGDELKSRIESAGFTINEAKTRMQVRGSRQTVTGLTVNEKVNIPQSYYKLARAMTNSLLTTGTYKRDGVNDSSVQRLEGVLNHIYHIKERQIDLAIDAEKNKEKRHALHAERTTQKNEYPSAIRLIYFQLVFFKHFIDLAKPLILCEGPTDSVYLKSAIRKQAALHPKLISTKDGKTSLNVHFFKYSKQSKDLLQLRGGSPDLKFFLEAWKETLVKFKHRPMKHPVIVLIDNDDGATQIFKLLQSKKFGVTIGLATDLPFYHLGENLYLVKTPIRGPDNKSCPEDFFDPAVLSTKIDGKTFNPNKEHDAPGEFGKVVFAERIVRPQAGTIDFSGFDPLLARIDAVLDDYAKRTAPGPAAAPSPPAAGAAPKMKKRPRAATAAAQP